MQAQHHDCNLCTKLLIELIFAVSRLPQKWLFPLEQERSKTAPRAELHRRPKMNNNGQYFWGGKHVASLSAYEAMPHIRAEQVQGHRKACIWEPEDETNVSWLALTIQNKSLCGSHSYRKWGTSKACILKTTAQLKMHAAVQVISYFRYVNLSRESV